jgi:hypothetical protein
MTVYDLRGLGPDFVVHYGGEESQIDAFTFGNSLVALANALQTINNQVNPGFSLEISVIALGSGSFRPKIRAKAKRLGGLIFGEFRQGIIGALGALIVSRCLGPDPEPRIEVTIDHVELHYQDGDVIIVPSDVYDAFRRSKDRPDVSAAIRQTFEVLEEDEGITNFGFARSTSETANLPFRVNRSRFADIARPRLPLVPGQREIIVRLAPLQIIRAIFEDSARRWQFVWRGNRISAPVLDREFRRKIMNREISITHGDVFVVDLRVIQTGDESGIWVNDAYEVLAIHNHQKAAEQPDLLTPT